MSQPRLHHAANAEHGIGQPIPLTAEDLRRAESGGFGQAAESGIKALRSSHHNLARTLAKGATVAEASAISGYTPVRIHQLKRSPAFNDLVDSYAGEVEAAFANNVERMSLLSRDAMEIMQERLLDNPEAISDQDLLKLATAMLDRSGHGPSSTTHTTHGIDSSVLDALKARAAVAEGTVIDAQSSQPVNERPAAGSLPEAGLGAGTEEGEGQ